MIYGFSLKTPAACRAFILRERGVTLTVQFPRFNPISKENTMSHALRYALTYIGFLLVCLSLGLFIAFSASSNAKTKYWAYHSTKLDVDVSHLDSDLSMMENYAISKESGNYTITASGKILKGAYGSKSHQSTRVLTMGEKQNASVTPLLLIDENDVEASHACAVGAMNEDHLYYLKTRGLNDTQALGLLTLSYVLPLLRIVEGSSFEEIIEKEIESKVGLSC